MKIGFWGLIGWERDLSEDLRLILCFVVIIVILDWFVIFVFIGIIIFGKSVFQFKFYSA